MAERNSMSATTELSLDAVPIVDLRRWRAGGDEAARFADDVRRTCHEVGFMVVEHHGVDRKLIDDIFELMPKVFALPDEVKATIDKRRSPHFRGWEAVGSEYTNGRVDVREQIDLWTEHDERGVDAEPPYLRLLGRNQWFADDVLPGSGDLVNRWISALAGLADEIMEVLSVGLGLDAGHLRQVFGDETMSLAKLIHYPPTPDGAAGVNAHNDSGFLTVLAAGTTPGLEVRLASGEWTAVPLVPYGFVINLGETLQAMSGNYYVATAHRVITNQERYSAAYFHGPALDVALTRLPIADEYAAAVEASPRHRDAGFMAPKAETEAGVGDMESTHRPDVYGEQLWNYFTRSYPSIVAEHYPDAV